MTLRGNTLLLVLVVGSSACGGAASGGGEEQPQPQVGAPTTTTGSTPSNAAAEGASGTGVEQTDPPAPQAGATDALPLLCPDCRPPAGGQTGDLGVIEERCPQPPRALTAEEEARFRTAELRAALTRSFAAPLTWGTLDEDLSLLSAISETMVEGEVSASEFLYDECHDRVSGPVTLRVATLDGQLGVTASDVFTLRADQLGWPADGPSLKVFLSDDLTSARGTLELPVNPSKVQEAELLASLQLSPDAVSGRLRVRMIDYANEADRAASGGDVLTAETIHEVVTGFYPDGDCGWGGRPTETGQPRNVLAGASWAQVFAQLPVTSGTFQVAGRWKLSGEPVDVVVELPDGPGELACEEPFSLRFAAPARMRTSDGAIDLELAQGFMSVEAYSQRLDNAHFRDREQTADLWLERRPDGQDAWLGYASRSDAVGVVVDSLEFALCDGDCE